jgi:hypothetical protein
MQVESLHQRTSTGPTSWGQKVKSFGRFADSTWIICRRVNHIPFYAEHWPTEKEEVDLCLLPDKHLVLYNTLYISPGKRRCFTLGTVPTMYSTGMYFSRLWYVTEMTSVC